MHQKNKSKEGIEGMDSASQNESNMGNPSMNQASLEQVLQNMVASMMLQQEVVQKQQVMQQEWMAQQMNKEKEKEKEPTKQLGPLPEYNGDREELEQWLSQARHKLETDYAGCSEKVKLSRFVPDTWPATSSHQQPPPVHVHILRRYHLALLSSLCNNTNTFSFILGPLQFVAPSIHLQDILPHPKSSRHQFFKPSRNQLPEPHAQYLKPHVEKKHASSSRPQELPQ